MVSTRVACGTCGHYNSGPCQRGNTCYHCSQARHFRRECPYLFHGGMEISEFNTRASRLGFQTQQFGGFQGQGLQGG